MVKKLIEAQENIELEEGCLSRGEITTFEQSDESNLSSVHNIESDDENDEARNSRPTEKKACSGLCYPTVNFFGIVLSICDPISDIASAVQNMLYGSTERVIHGIMILLPILGSVLINHVSGPYRKQEDLLVLSPEENVQFKSWWLKTGIIDPCYWSFKHWRATGEYLQNKDNPNIRSTFYKTKQMMQLSVKNEAQMEASFQAGLTLFRILRFYNGFTADFWISVASLIFSALSIARAASSDLVKTNIKGGNDKLIEIANSEDLTKSEMLKIEKENEIILGFYNTMQPKWWKIARIGALVFLTGAVLIANVTCILALYLGWTGSTVKHQFLYGLNASVDFALSEIVEILPLQSLSSTCVHIYRGMSKVIFNNSEGNVTLPVTTVSTVFSGQCDPDVMSGILGLLFVFGFNAFVFQFTWGLVAAKDFFTSDLFPVTFKDKVTAWIYFILRSPFICMFRSASLYYYSLPKSVMTGLVLQNASALIVLMIPALIFIHLIGWVIILVFMLCLVGYIVCTIASCWIVGTMNLESLAKNKRFLIQKIAQLP